MSSWVFFLRGVLAATLAFTAAWKIRHPAEFRAAFRRSLPRVYWGFDRPLSVLLPLGECLLALALVIPSPLGQPAALATLFVLLGFTVSVARIRDRGVGCGCWRSPQGDSYSPLAYVARNGILVVASILAALPFENTSWSLALLLVVAAVPVALVVLEIPSFSVLVRPPTPTP